MLQMIDVLLDSLQFVYQTKVSKDNTINDIVFDTFILQHIFSQSGPSSLSNLSISPVTLVGSA